MLSNDDIVMMGRVFAEKSVKSISVTYERGDLSKLMIKVVLDDGSEKSLRFCIKKDGMFVF